MLLLRTYVSKKLESEVGPELELRFIGYALVQSILNFYLALWYFKENIVIFFFKISSKMTAFFVCAKYDN